jgi:DNA-binding MarR family transcriptional regulator
MSKAIQDGEFHRLLAKSHRLHSKRSFTDLAKIGISHGQPRILHYLSSHDGCIQRTIAENFDLEPATVTDILAVMEKAELVRRETDPDDRRALRVFLTKKGARIHTEVEEIFVAVEKECFRGFSRDEKQQTLRFLERIYDNLKSGTEANRHD